MSLLRQGNARSTIIALSDSRGTSATQGSSVRSSWTQEEERLIIDSGALLLLTMYAHVIVELRGATEYLGISLAPCTVLLHGGGSPKAALAKGVAPLLS